MSDYQEPQVVHAARNGDQRALDELIASYLPLIYNIVGRALQGHADVDDVVQETMLKVVNGISGLRDPAAFRSWAVSIAMREVRDSRRRGPRVSGGGLEELQGVADPGADFVDLTILQLGLTDQRRETAEATRWLEEADRDLLALWWLEAAGQITRGELAAALEVTPAYAAVRVQRMKAQLETARAVVRAIWATPRCEGLDEEIRDWDGHPSPPWRKRLARHMRACPQCSAYQRHLVPAESLLAGIALVPPPATSLHIASGVWPISPRPATSAKPSGRGSGRTRARLLTSKPVLAAVVIATSCTGVAVALTAHRSPTSAGTEQAADPASGVPATSSATPAPPSPTASATGPTAVPSSSATRNPGRPTATTTRTSRAPSIAPPATAPATTTTTSTTRTTSSPFYGQTVDTVDTAPDRFAKPGPLPKRPEAVPITATGNYSQPFKGSLGGKYLMFWNGQSVTITGTGYFCVRYEIAWFNRVGPMVMPTWTGLQGKLFHVASGGGRRMSDSPSGEPADYTWMGNTKAGYITLPPGAQQMWNNEFFYLDGTVTLHENEGFADYNLAVTPYTGAQVAHDIDAAPDGKGIIRYGLVRDTGTDAAPVPQYLTRSTPANATTVPQQSVVSPTP